MTAQPTQRKFNRLARRTLGGVFGCGVALGASTFWPAPASARQGVVKTTDGRTIEGDVNNERPDSVVITVKGVQTTLPREQVASVTLADSLDEEYRKRAAALPANADATGHVDLARWLFERRAYDFAREQLEIARRIDPGQPDVEPLSRTIDQQMHLDRTRLPAGSGETTRPSTAGRSTLPAGEHTAAEHKYLSPQQINALKIAEWQPGDTSVRAQLVGDVGARYIQYATVDRAAFNALTPAQKAAQILENGTPEMRKDVKVLNDPVPLAEYRRTIQPMILTGCATAGCHGGREGGRFFLYSTNDEGAAYTSFYLLATYTQTIDKTLLAAVDRSYPEESLLAQYGLAESISTVKHPQVPKGAAWRGVFAGKDDPHYRQLIKWMGQSLGKPEPKYTFKFSLDDKGGDTPATPATRSTGGAPTPPARSPARAAPDASTPTPTPR